MKLITFEGIERVGKTTNIKYLAKLLLKKKYSVKLTREPGGTFIGEKIRKIILQKKNKDSVSALAELFLVLAARYQHIEKIIIPALMKKNIVLCDRFIDSTYAYQSGGRNIPIKKIKVIEKLFFFKISPDFVFLLNYPIKKSISSLKKDTKIDRIEEEKISFFIKVKKIYIKRRLQQQ